MANEDRDSVWAWVSTRVLQLLSEIGVGSGGVVPSPHALSSGHHSGQLADSQAPQFLLRSGARSLTGDLAVGPGIRVDGVSISAFRSEYLAHIGNPDAHHPGFVGLRDSAGILVAPDGADYITLLGGQGMTTAATGNSISLAVRLATPAGLIFAGGGLRVGQGAGIMVNNDNVALITPGSLSVDSLNSSIGSHGIGSHTHQVAASSNPGAAAALLRTDAQGNLTLYDLDVVSTNPNTPLILTSNNTSNQPAMRVSAPSQTTAPAIEIILPVALGTQQGRAVNIRGPNDTNPRLSLHSSGMFAVGPGTAAQDVWFSRLATRTLLVSGDGIGAQAANLAVAGYGAFGDTAVPVAALDARSDTEQLRLRYDTDNYASFRVGGGGNLAIQPTGDIILDPAGKDVLPARPYEVNVGSIQKKYLTGHFAELWVETLVAQETMATIGGRVLVGPTTSLVVDFPQTATAMTVKYNNLQVNDTVYLEANMRVEFMRVTGTINNPVRNASFEQRNSNGTFGFWAIGGGVVATQVTDAPSTGRSVIRLA